jgi:UDP-glucose 4-epimerase
MIKGSHILITGGLGAIGSALSREVLRRDPASVTIIDDFSSSAPDLTLDIVADPRVTHLRRSIVSDECLRHAFLERQQDIVFHLAANFAHQSSLEHPVVDCEVNSLGTTKMLEYAKNAHVKKFVFASSSCVYGNAKSYAIDNTDYHLDTPYAINKLHGELLVKFYHEHHGLDTVILRYFNSFGPGELPGAYRNVIPNFFMRAMQGLPLLITGDKTTSRDFNFVDNTVQGTLLAATSATSGGKLYNIGSGSEVTIIDLATIINTIADNTAGTEFRPPRGWDSIKNRCADISVTVDELGYAPVIDFEKQLRTTYEWISEHRRHFIPA